MLVKARYWTQDTPLGPIRVGTTPKGVAKLSWDFSNFNYDLMKVAIDSAGAAGAYSMKVDFQEGIDPHVAAQLAAYFEGKLKEFSVSIDWDSITNLYQNQILQYTLNVEYGKTTTYGKLAGNRTGLSNQARRAGQALASNPILIIIPCHRVIGSDGKLKGYAGGVDKKESLLKLEGAL